MASPSIFSLENKSLKLDTEEATLPHLEPLISNPSITEIRLGGNTLGVPACTAIASVLSTKLSLQVANLADIFTSRLLSEIPTALSALLTALLACPNLHTVDLSDNAFGLNTVAPLVAFLKAHTPLAHLILNNNGLGPIAGAQIAEALSELSRRKKEDGVKKKAQGEHDALVPTLQTIVCGRNRLESGSMKAWAAALKAHEGVTVVRMIQNGIRQDGMVLLLQDGLKGCRGLEILDLQDNTFTVSGARALADAVSGWGNLKELGVSDCYLSAKGGILVAEALGKGENKELRTLRAQYNDLDVKGVRALVSAAKVGLPALRRVDLNGNKFSEEDDAVEELRALFDERKEEAGAEDGEWGLDELSDLEEESEEEEDEDEEKEEEQEEEREEKAEGILKEADQEENAIVSQKKDEEVDALASRLEKTEL
ncbi:Ran GTPase-activating protein 1 [Loxospora ochrophaea]|nr:Ran GTPase-activating protein 1 [Loxospora ochrophaea]